MLRKSTILVLGTMLLFAGMALAQTQNDVQITKGPVVEHTDASSAVIAWSTNVPSSTVVTYGTDQNNLNQSAQAPWGSLTHRVTINNLEPNKTYYFQAKSGQAQGSGTGALSAIGTFTTTGTAASNANQQENNKFSITNGPVIENVSDTSATVAWSTDRPSSSIVKYGTDPNNLDQTAQQPWGATTHRVQITNLQPNTQYYFSVQSAQGLNAPGQQAASQAIPFRTAAVGQQASTQPH